MELTIALPIIIYFLLIVLLVILIVIGLKVIIAMNKTLELVNDIKSKLSTFDKLFNILDLFNNRFSILTESIVNFLTDSVKKIIRKKNKEEEE